MSQLIARSLLPGMALLLASCSSTMPDTPTKPSPFGNASRVSITAQSVASLQGPSPVSCPAVTPFVSSFLVTVTPIGGLAIVVTNITTQFTSAGTGPGTITAPPVTLPAPIPTAQFGTALDQAKNPQSFPINVCRSATPGTVVIFVDTRDATGRTSTGSVMVGVP